MSNLPQNPYFKAFSRLKAYQYEVGNSSYSARLAKLNALKRALEYSYKDRLREALYNDFKKPVLETDLTELYLVIKEIKHTKSHLRAWMKKQKVETPITLLGTSSWIKLEPKGVCLIISPWNYPINLTFAPLVSAIAAGNTVIIKPSELTPNTSAVMAQIVSDIFSDKEIVLIEGEVEVAQDLLKLPFNHIFFTGSPQVGKIVMKAAAEHLTSVTLELGGKSPTIIDETADLENAVRKIVWGKHINNGQTCIAPDYILIHKSVKEEFIKRYKASVLHYYSKEASTSDSYCRIVNNRHFNRLVKHIEDAKDKSAVIELGGRYNSDDNFIEPTLISNLPEDASLLQDEIFGPILPIKTYRTIDEVISYVNSKEKPLALYIYSKNKKAIRSIIDNTRAGTTCINTNALQYSNHNLPFGGSNNSGIGKSHGIYGFKEFSNMRAVLKRHTKGPVDWLTPPYSGVKQKLMDFTIKWL
ncbi:aldehyde dehydrogenase family protein [Flavobacteriales bacterium 34_180_T64]|nr:aldehyde dehydrogenase family protein [Flavobacteriales bacterium 34_180_T64]